MNSRERLKDAATIAEYYNEIDAAAALRELDQLLTLTEAYFAQDHAGKPETNGNCVECGILERLRQAGYGEK